MGLQNGEPLIHDLNAHRHLNVVINGEVKGRGAVPRDYDVQPPETFSPPSEIKVYSEQELREIIREKDAKKSRNSDILRAAGIRSMDQGQFGYCWGHSVVGAVQGARAAQGLPHEDLSAFAVCATIKRGRNEGGWCGLAMQFVREKGVPTVARWPQGDADYRKYDKPEVWADAKTNIVTEDYVDLTREVYNQNLTFMQALSCLAQNFFIAMDFNWWAHSVLGCDPVDLSNADIRDDDSGKLITGPQLVAMLDVTSGFGVRDRNSWTDSYGEQGFFVLTGSKAIPDGAVAIRVVGAAA